MSKIDMTSREAMLAAWAVSEFINRHGFEILRRVRDGEETDYAVRRMGDDNAGDWSYFAKCEDAYGYALKMIAS